MKKVQYPEGNDACGWHIDCTDMEKVDPIDSPVLMYGDRRVAFLKCNGEFVFFGVVREKS